MISASVAPLARFIIAITSAFLLAPSVFGLLAGYIDAAAVLGNYDETFLSSVSPSAIYDPISQRGHLVLPLTSNWKWCRPLRSGVTQCSRMAALSGTLRTCGVRATWGTSIAWGTGGSWDTSIAWGTSGAGEQ